MSRDRINNSSGQYECGVDCRIATTKIDNVSGYLEYMTSVFESDSRYWFRGQKNISWRLTPTALRHSTERARAKALSLVDDFKRVAEIKLDRPPSNEETLKWLQLAQHYGIPTRLLDWTESALFGLYFAIARISAGDDDSDGIVFVLNPDNLIYPTQKASDSEKLSSNLSEDLVRKYLELAPREARKPNSRTLRTIRVEPVWNSPRLMMQRGKFTLHGRFSHALDANEAPSLVGVPIPSSKKKKLREELDNLGIDEMTMFPELEYASQSLKRRAGLD